MRPIYYDREGKPIDLIAWIALRAGDPSYIRVGDDTVCTYRVSTVLLGLDHAFTGPPQIFETMVFGAAGDVFCERYSTLDEAETGHALTCERLRRGRLEMYT